MESTACVSMERRSWRLVGVNTTHQTNSRLRMLLSAPFPLHCSKGKRSMQGMTRWREREIVRRRSKERGVQNSQENESPDAVCPHLSTLFIAIRHDYRFPHQLRAPNGGAIRSDGNLYFPSSYWNIGADDRLSNRDFNNRSYLWPITTWARAKVGGGSNVCWSHR